MICRHYGAALSLDYVSELCNATKEGVSMLAISEAAESLCLETATIKATTNRLRQLPMPCVLHWNQNHFVVLYRIAKSGKHFYVADPGKGLIKYGREEFESHWLASEDNGVKNGVVMLFHPEPEFEKYAEDVRRENRSLKFIAGYFTRYRNFFVHIFAGLLLGCLLQLLMPFLTQSIVDVGIKNRDLNIIWLILLGELMIIVSQTATDFIRRWILLHVSMRINISLVSDFFIKLLKLPMSFFDTKLTGDLLQRMGDHTRVQNFMTLKALNLLFTLMSFVIFGIVLFVYNKLIFGILALCSIIYGLWIAVFLKKRKALDYYLFEQQSINQTKTFQFITNLQEIKLQNCEKRRRHEWEDIQAELFGIQMRSLKLQQSQEAGSIFINELKNIVITVMAASAVVNGQMTLGAMLAVQYIIGQLNSPVEQFMSFIFSLQDVRISLERINEIHQRKTEEKYGDRYTAFVKPSEGIELDHISFKYDPHALQNTINDVSMTIPQGKVTAIIGASGSGKSTLIKLMLGYYDVASGVLNIAGGNVKNYNKKWWRNQCGVVMQDGVIFSESIGRNIAVGDEDVDEERLEYAARMANIHDYVMGLPLKYNTEIGMDGVGLSQGQKQRILIARAIYKNPQYIFLDEATNALDAKNERQIVENLNDFYKGRTVIVVAHRLSTVRNADKIIVLDNGEVAETGTHDELVRRKGAYFKLVSNQLELGL